jgi:predicted XRE-type DNA-binding protein
MYNSSSIEWKNRTSEPSPRIGTSLELKLKWQIYHSIVGLIRSKNYSRRQLERLFDVPQPRVSQLLTGNLGMISIKRLLWYVDKLGGSANIKIKKSLS